MAAETVHVVLYGVSLQEAWNQAKGPSYDTSGLAAVVAGPYYREVSESVSQLRRDQEYKHIEAQHIQVRTLTVELD
jgi:hypothetical protein